jgi:hypothetical protein
MQIKNKLLILITLLLTWATMACAQNLNITNGSNVQTDSVAVKDTLDYDQGDRLISWLSKSIVLNDKQKKAIGVKGKMIKEIFKNKGKRTNETKKQLQAEYKVALDSILTTAQQEQLAPQFKASDVKLKSKPTIVKQ